MNQLASNGPVAVTGAGAIHIEITDDGTPQTWPVQHPTAPVLVEQNDGEQHAPALPYGGPARSKPEVSA